jgi:MULE transposase domain
MKQIVFFHPLMRELTQRFCLEFVAIIDATFNTNRLRMPFIQIIRIINTGKSFPALFSFAMSESKLAFNFIFETSRDLIFTGQNVTEPGVIISD